MLSQIRVLQVLGDTDDLVEHRAALELHSSLSELGLQMRTLALGPGPVGGLDTTVPTIAPARRSFAARSQLAAERRWADVVVLHGDRSLGFAAMPRSNDPVPVVVAHWGPQPLPGRRAEWSAGARTVRCAAVVVVTSDDLAERLKAARPHLADVIAVADADLVGGPRPRVDACVWSSILSRVVA